MPAEVPAAVPPPASEAERQFQDGWAALRARDPVTAVPAFQRAATAAGTAPLGEDARFWHAVALSRAGRKGEARTALAGFVSAYPASPRAGEAAAMLGWALLDEGDLTGAATHFRAAARDKVSEVRASGEAGLAAITARAKR